jgi:LPXTG-site transpeptidase (sortase) family protein
MYDNWQDNRGQPFWMFWRLVLLGLLTFAILFGSDFTSAAPSWPQSKMAPLAAGNVVNSAAKTAVSALTSGKHRQMAVLHLAPVQINRVDPAVMLQTSRIVSLDEINKRVAETAVRILPPEPENQIPLFPQTSQISTPAAKAPLQDAQLIIPSLNVAQYIGIVPIVNGEWDVSDLGAGVGHLTSTGVAPGDDWAMTFVGHATIPWPQAGAFADLIRLEHGEEIIYRWNGQDYIYEVARILIVTPDFVEGVYEENGRMLMLVTCSGWNSEVLAYTNRMITRAELVRVEPSPSTPLYN